MDSVLIAFAISSFYPLLEFTAGIMVLFGVLRVVTRLIYRLRY